MEPLYEDESLAASEKWTVERRMFLQGATKVGLLPNLLAEVAVFLIRK